MKDGGSAFPRPLSVSHGSVADHQYSACEQDGMSLRDYFAAKAMHAELNTAGAFEGPAQALADEAARTGRTIEQQIAFNAYKLADAMLAEREKE